MARFLNTLSVTLLNCVANSGRGEWVLDADLQFQSDVAHQFWLDQGRSENDAFALSILTAPKGFKTDFMSVPPEVPGVVSLSRSRRAGVIHDWLYSQPHFINDRDTCDHILREMFITDLTECGAAEAAEDVEVVVAEADAVYLGVHIGGASHWD